MDHHAYYIEGGMSQYSAYKEHLKPFWTKEFERFGVDEARALIQLASLKNIGRTVFFIAAASITNEAQQALLKLFEEPQQGTTFVFLVSHGALIATLRSRMLAFPVRLPLASQKVLGSTSSQPDYFVRQAGAFLKFSYKERSEEVAALLKDEEGARERVREFLNELERVLYEKTQKSKSTPEIRRGLEDIAKCRSYAGDRSPSLKMLLEHLAVSLPRL